MSSANLFNEFHHVFLFLPYLFDHLLHIIDPISDLNDLILDKSEGVLLFIVVLQSQDVELFAFEAELGEKRYHFAPELMLLLEFVLMLDVL